MTQLNSRHVNRLAYSQSPYLLQHAHNPVDWYPWCPEAFEKAQQDNKLIFLSIGYSTCHWCHVMERECFENESIAAIMNDNFISIKVDREEYPEVDELYMTALTRVMGQQGGWPLSMWLTPDLKPFFGGTYFAPDARYGRPGFPTLLEHLAQAWSDNGGAREKILNSASEISEWINKSAQAVRAPSLTPLKTDEIVERYLDQFDSEEGGFGSAPKFPQPTHLDFLIQISRHPSYPELWKKPELQLQRMARGGIYDHLGGGFARYATDRKWRIPHFEKMLYDNAQLIRSYARAFWIRPDPEFRKIIEETVGYVFREMEDPSGGFYSAQDADSEGVEGKFYVWRRDEIEEILGKKADAFCEYYSVTAEGNWEGDHHHPTPGINILYRNSEKPFDLELDLKFAAMRSKLLDARSKRIPPLKDDKILTSWNGLMISALAVAGRALVKEEWVAKAERAAIFFLDKLSISETGYQMGQLFRRFRNGERGGEGILEDYTYLAEGLIDLYEVTGNKDWKFEAMRLMNIAFELFADRENGNFFLASSDRVDLISRNKDLDDGAFPSASTVGILNLLRIGPAGEKQEKFLRESVEIGKSLLYQAPLSTPGMMLAEGIVEYPPPRFCELGSTDPRCLPPKDDSQHSNPWAIQWRVQNDES